MNETAGDASVIHDVIKQAWPGAIAHWSSFLVLNEPALDAHQPAIAQIDLGTRRVSLNEKLIGDMGLHDCVPAMLAHEVGHHVSYPGTLQVQARLHLLERTVVPFPQYSFVNAFTDLMINERLGRTDLRAQMVRIYQAGIRRSLASHADAWKRDPFFVFYLALYETLWDSAEGEILGSVAASFREEFPHYRAEAAVLTQDLFVLGPNLYTQFLYFLSLSIRYLIPVITKSADTEAVLHVATDGKGCNCGEPSPSDWAQALRPTAAEKEAIRRAIEKGWFDERQSKRLLRAADINERMSALPGLGSADASVVPEIMAAYYRQQAERLLFRPPAHPRIGEPVLPSVLEDWTPTDPVRDIDWLATLNLRGDKAGPAMPLKRLHEAEIEGEDVRFHGTRMEIYLDVSGSMPNPCINLNPMTLAAQILTTATTRACGQVRLALYSHDTVRHWEWSRSEREMSGFLMHYIGDADRPASSTLFVGLRHPHRDRDVTSMNKRDRHRHEVLLAHAFGRAHNNAFGEIAVRGRFKRCDEAISRDDLAVKVEREIRIDGQNNRLVRLRLRLCCHYARKNDCGSKVSRCHWQPLVHCPPCRYPPYNDPPIHISNPARIGSYPRSRFLVTMTLRAPRHGPISAATAMMMAIRIDRFAY
jgi:hypothetical protein